MQLAFCEDNDKERKQFLDFTGQYAKEHNMHPKTKSFDSTNVSEGMIELKCGRIMVSVQREQIQYAEVYNHKTTLYMTGRSLTASHSLSALEDILGGDPFLRCYRSYIVNMDYIEKIDDSSFVMKDGVYIPITRDGRKGILSHYMTYLLERF
ncbi:MAG: LytTR family transcriptional regulator DNA-binding domain-containing protein [Lachnospiraceae bacterium]|nr:LytTR family transcriptional regulator DNA-binding domain-containing protein [Lachnospiraceae bacterium]